MANLKRSEHTSTGEGGGKFLFTWFPTNQTETFLDMEEQTSMFCECQHFIFHIIIETRLSFVYVISNIFFSKLYLQMEEKNYRQLDNYTKPTIQLVLFNQGRFVSSIRISALKVSYQCFPVKQENLGEASYLFRLIDCSESQERFSLIECEKKFMLMSMLGGGYCEMY